ncbi:hypothetical protein BGW36DRAFT_302377 [Talaromyces proteolyticus]|uniref:Uncharacterized protein n=1 Tax=Talaromyces proteolyticus TaxID=1131652 RepID=A0AAD4KJP2_9EURO|nr:uncharacterized protein BGW36DRAFT_302377 [Talaromyces proteolyticus]KAH8693005.1 hypothetical protein BGW36DRAFT_302377 [Talaromyces proteolyticus]
MPRAKRSLAEADLDVQLSTSRKSSKNKAEATRDSRETTITNASSGRNKDDISNEINHSNLGPSSVLTRPTLSTERPLLNTATEPRFILICRPYWDVEAENRDKESEAHDEQHTCGTDCVCKAPANDFPQWTWAVSEEGLHTYELLKKQAFNRDQDAQGLYIYNDFTAYGINEVVDNWLKDFNKTISRRTVSPYAVWAQLEGISMFLQLDYIDIWFHGDDCRGVAETIALVGKALLTSLQVLKDHRLLNSYQPENGGLRNISIVLAMFVEFARSWTDMSGDHYGETKWVSKVGKLAMENSIDIKGPYKFHERNQQILEPEPEKDSTSDGQPKKKKKKIHFSNGTWGLVSFVDADSDDDDIKDNGDYSVRGWKESFKTYAKHHTKGGRKTIGGTSYDITKISKSEKKRFELDGVPSFSF